MFFLSSSTGHILQFPHGAPAPFLSPSQSPKRHRKPPKHQSDPHGRRQGKLDFCQIRNLQQEATGWLIYRWPRTCPPRRRSRGCWNRQHRSQDPSWIWPGPLLQLTGLLLFLTRRHYPFLCEPEHILLSSCNSRSEKKRLCRSQLVEVRVLWSCTFSGKFTLQFSFI